MFLKNGLKNLEKLMGIQYYLFYEQKYKKKIFNLKEKL